MATPNNNHSTAVFFDEIRIDFEYEKEYLTLPSKVRYLPDFYLPQFSAYLEVKPNSDSIVTEECVKARELASDLRGTDTNVIGKNIKKKYLNILEHLPQQTGVKHGSKLEAAYQNQLGK